jgi:hypothetical protein
MRTHLLALQTNTPFTGCWLLQAKHAKARAAKKNISPKRKLFA